MKIEVNREKAIHIQPSTFSKEAWHQDLVGLARVYGGDYLDSPHYNLTTEAIDIATEFSMMCTTLSSLNENLNNSIDRENIEAFKEHIINRVLTKTGKYSTFTDKQIKAIKIDLEIVISHLVQTQDKAKLKDLVEKLDVCPGVTTDSIRRLADDYTTPSGFWPALTKVRVNVKEKLAVNYLRRYPSTSAGVNIHLPIIFANLTEFHGIPLLDSPVENGVQRFPDGDFSVTIQGSPGNISFTSTSISTGLRLNASGQNFVNNFENEFFDLFESEVVEALADNLKSIIEEKFELAIENGNFHLSELLSDLLRSQYQIPAVNIDFILEPLDSYALNPRPKLHHDKTLQYWCLALSAHALQLNGVAQPYPREIISNQPPLELVKVDELEYFVSGNEILHPAQVISFGVKNKLLDKILQATKDSPFTLSSEIRFNLEQARKCAADSRTPFECSVTHLDLIYVIVQSGTAQQLAEALEWPSAPEMLKYRDASGLTIMQSMQNKIRTTKNRSRNTQSFASNFTDEDLNKFAVLIKAVSDYDERTLHPILFELALYKKNSRLLTAVTANNLANLSEAQIIQLLYISLESNDIDLFTQCINLNRSKYAHQIYLGESFLYHAVKFEREWAVIILLPNALNSQNQKILTIAKEKNPDILALLINNGYLEDNILEWATQQGNWKVLLALANKGISSMAVFKLAIERKNNDWIKIAYACLKIKGFPFDISNVQAANNIGQIDLAMNIFRILARKRSIRTTSIVHHSEETTLYQIACDRQWPEAEQYNPNNPFCAKITELIRESIENGSDGLSKQIQQLPLELFQGLDEGTAAWLCENTHNIDLIIQSLHGLDDNFAPKFRSLYFQNKSAVNQLLANPDLDLMYSKAGHLNLCKLAGIAPNSGAALKLYAHSVECDLRRKKPAEPNHPKVVELAKGIAMPINNDEEKKACNSTLLFALNFSDKPEFSWFRSTPLSLTQLPAPLKQRFFTARK